MQKNYTSINVKGDLSLIGLDSDAYLKGVSLIFNVADNVISKSYTILSASPALLTKHKFEISR